MKAGVSEQINRRAGRSVRLQPPGQRPEQRFPLIVEALARLRSRSCIIDGEAVACDDNGIASFDQIRHRHGNRSIEPLKFETRREPKNWCAQDHPGSPINEIGADGVKRTVRAPARKAK